MDDSILVLNTRDPLGGLSPAQFEEEARRLLGGRALAAYFFGSYGSPGFGRDSDVDMIVVARTDRTFVERALEYPELFDLVPDLDLLVYTPEEFAALTTEPSAGFWTSATASLRRFL
jgi:predicted nucleotidyltransferase